jgi:hypothetical protein
MPYGVVLFDDVVRNVSRKRKADATDGFASIDGAPARRIVSVNELDSNVKWLTNFEFTDFNANGLLRNPNYFFSGFLRTDLKQLADEIGAGPDQLNAREASSMLSTLFGRVMRLAEQSLGVQFVNTKMSTRGLSDFIADRVVNRNKIPDDANAAFKAAYQTWIPLVVKVPREWKRIMLRRPRYRHAVEVLSTPVPSEFQWVYVQGSRLPADKDARITWCLGNELPVVANVIVKPRRNEFMDLISYNAGAQQERAWVCQPELLMLSQFCEVEVIGAFVCEAGFEEQKELTQFPDLGDFTEASLSLGLLAENFWVSMASPRTTPTNAKFWPPRAVWYRAMDRLAMFMNAVKMQREGFKVFGYGTGALCVYYPPGATSEMVDFSLITGLDVPASAFADLKNEVRLSTDETAS